MSKKSVYVVGPTFGIGSLFREKNYTFYTDETVGDNSFDLITFMGGVDINPKLYGEEPVKETQRPNNHRDSVEIALYRKYKDKPKLGICRGAQLLNVLNGGKLQQHINGHNGGNHEIKDIFGVTVLSSSVHHQMMKPAKNAEIIAVAKQDTTVPEILFIPEKKELLVQGHPEFGPDVFSDYVFNLIDRLIWEKY